MARLATEPKPIRLEPTADEWMGMMNIIRWLRLMRARTNDDDYDELADALEVKLAGPWGPSQ